MYRVLDEPLPEIPADPGMLASSFTTEIFAANSAGSERVVGLRYRVNDLPIGFSTVSIKPFEGEAYWDLFYPLQAFDDDGVERPTGRGVGTLAQNGGLGTLLEFETECGVGGSCFTYGGNPGQGCCRIASGVSSGGQGRPYECDPNGQLYPYANVSRHFFVER